MSPPTSQQPERSLPVAAILIMIAKGMKPFELAAVFPELTHDEIRRAILQAAELLKDPDASLPASGLRVQAIIEKARRNADLSEDDAMTRAVALTRAYRRDKASGTAR